MWFAAWGKEKTATEALDKSREARRTTSHPPESVLWEHDVPTEAVSMGDTNVLMSAYPNAPPTVTPSTMCPTVPMDYVADADMSALDHVLAPAQQIPVNGVCASASP